LPKSVSGGEVHIGASLAIVHQFQVVVPYPGKYAIAELKVAETNSESSVSFLVPVNNLGEQDIVNAKGVIDIYGSTNEKITTLYTNEVGIKSGDRIELTAAWEEEILNPGRYLAKVTVVYDGEVTKEVENMFNVGGADLSVLQMKVNEDFKLGDIAKFNILVESNWPEEIEQVFAEMVVYTLDNKEVIRFKSSTESIEALGKQELIAYWDTEGIKEDEYKTTLVVHYGDQTFEQDMKAVVSLTSIEFSDYSLTGEVVYGGEGIDKTTVLIGLVVILIIINIGWFIYMRRKKKK